MSDPEPFSEELNECMGFSSTMVFQQKTITFVTDQVLILYIIGLLHGRALAWDEAFDAHQPVTSLTTFLKILFKVFP